MNPFRAMDEYRHQARKQSLNHPNFQTLKNTREHLRQQIRALAFLDDVDDDE